MIAVMLFAIVSTGLLQTPAQAADPRREPATAIAEGIRLLEAKDYVTFVKTCFRPSEVEELTKKFGTVEDVAKALEKAGKPAQLLEVLKAASTLTPTLNATGTRADYKFEKPVAGANRLSLAKVGDLWYLRD
jgi:hypothetical protein